MEAINIIPAAKSAASANDQSAMSPGNRHLKFRALLRRRGPWLIVVLFVAGAGWRVIFTVAPIAFAFACAFLTGIVFGCLPAKKASQLDPIVALARE